MGAHKVVPLALILLLIGGAVAIPLPAARAPAVAPLPSGEADAINVTATADYHYQPDTFQQVATNSIITVTFTDADLLPHSFTISSREGFVIPTSYTPTQLDQLFSEYPALYSVLLNGPGAPSVGTFSSPPAAGWYEFVCNVSGHFQNGMYGFIAFGENLPANLTPPTRVGLGGVVITPLEAAVLGGGLLAVVLLWLVWRRRRTALRTASMSARTSRSSHSEVSRTGDDPGKGPGPIP